MYERQIFGSGGKVGKCLGCFHMGVVITLERPCRKSRETRLTKTVKIFADMNVDEHWKYRFLNFDTFRNIFKMIMVRFHIFRTERRWTFFLHLMSTARLVSNGSCELVDIHLWFSSKLITNDSKAPVWMSEYCEASEWVCKVQCTTRHSLRHFWGGELKC